MEVGQALCRVERRGGRLVPRRLLPRAQSGDVAPRGDRSRRRAIPPGAPAGDLHRRRLGAARAGAGRLRHLDGSPASAASASGWKPCSRELRPTPPLPAGSPSSAAASPAPRSSAPSTPRAARRPSSALRLTPRRPRRRSRSRHASTPGSDPSLGWRPRRFTGRSTSTRRFPAPTIAAGAVRLEAAERDAARFAAIAGGGLFPEGALRTSIRRRVPSCSASPRPAALWLAEAAVVSPAVLLAAWIGADAVEASVAGLERRDGAWRLVDARRRDADDRRHRRRRRRHREPPRLVPGLPLGVVRGQASIAAAPGPRLRRPSSAATPCPSPAG